MTEPTEQTISYFIESRPHPGAPWQRATVTTVAASWVEKPKALDRLAARREMQPTWEHRLMQRTTTVTECPVDETTNGTQHQTLIQVRPDPPHITDAIRDMRRHGLPPRA